MKDVLLNTHAFNKALEVAVTQLNPFHNTMSQIPPSVIMAPFELVFFLFSFYFDTIFYKNIFHKYFIISFVFNI